MDWFVKMAYVHVCMVIFGIGSAIYLILIYIKHIIHIAIDNDTIVILSRVMYENQQLKRRVVYLTNQMNQVNNLISNGSDVSQ